MDQVLQTLKNTPYFTTKTGSGLGLPIVNKIINEHFGEINIKNKKNGNGTIINILQKLMNKKY